jgi:hypothetical protein
VIVAYKAFHRNNSEISILAIIKCSMTRSLLARALKLKPARLLDPHV